ncbi:hypothetical protein [Primorskyibacter flagellatus]|uniref:Uncharacterized protein n=1 Tax=Primorskyibacter flagellatus TaxID=1387277 RepID=A0A1W2E3M7_9RHOB|nr:hypothetical protein [Primorskyibacter flagellatus]SMD04295.1 hypothetical protein SAMN06295998_12168 [Primorskyibacter flagellatus]
MSIIGVTQYIVPAISAQPLKVPKTGPDHDNSSGRHISIKGDAVPVISAKGLTNGTEQPHAAPPSVLQLKILALLKEQEEARLLRDGAEETAANTPNRRVDEGSADSPASNPLDERPISFSYNTTDPAMTMTDGFVIPTMSADALAQNPLGAAQQRWHLKETAPLTRHDLRLELAR